MRWAVQMNSHRGWITIAVHPDEDSAKRDKQQRLNHAMITAHGLRVIELKD